MYVIQRVTIIIYSFFYKNPNSEALRRQCQIDTISAAHRIGWSQSRKGANPDNIHVYFDRNGYLTGKIIYSSVTVDGCTVVGSMGQ